MMLSRIIDILATMTFNNRGRSAVSTDSLLLARQITFPNDRNSDQRTSGPAARPTDVA